MLRIFYIVMLMIIAYEDYKYKKIPDRSVLIIAGLGILSAVSSNEIQIGKRFLGMFLAFLIFFIILIFKPESFGGGDIKLSMALGFYMGPERWLNSFMIAVCMAAVYILFQFLKKKAEWEKEIAFGPFLCMGALIIHVLSIVDY